MTDPGPIPPRFLRFEGSEGLSLAADTVGDDDRPTVLLAHGGGQTRHAWGGAALALALRGWRAVSIDQRGHGDSDRSPEKNYLMGHFGADLRAVAGQLDRPVAVGASLGGIAALIAEGESPEPVLRAVVLVDITPRVRPEGAARVVDFMKAHVESGFDSLEEVADAVADRKDRVDARVGALKPAQPTRLVEDFDGKMLGYENVCLCHVTIERRRVVGAQDTQSGEALADPRRIAFIVLRAGKVDKDSDGIARGSRGGERHG